MRLVDGHVFFLNIFFSALLREKSLSVSGCLGCAKICLRVLCQEDITVLGQSVQKSSLSAFTHIQNASEELWKRYQTNFIREHSLQYCLGGYCGHNIHVSIHVHPCHPLPQKTGKHFQCLNIVLYNKTGPLFGVQLMSKKISAFLKNSLTKTL